MQVVSSEWVLGVQIQHFDNPNNAAFLNNPNDPCCCDVNPHKCASATVLNKTLCYDECETYFVILVRDCPYNKTCSNEKFIEVQYGNLSPNSSRAPVLIQFEESELSNGVRMNKSLIN